MEPIEPIGGSSAWHGEDEHAAAIVDVHDLPERASVELRSQLGAPVGSWSTPSVELATFVRNAIEHGPRYVVLRSLPGGHDELERAKDVLRWLLHGIGRVLPQNVDGDELYEVVDRSDPRGFYGGSRGTDALRDHTDQAAAPAQMLADVMALWCVEPAKVGGESLLASGHTLHDEVLAADPALARTLYEPFPFARPADGTSAAPPTWAPVFLPTPAGVEVRYCEYFVTLGEEATGTALTGEQRAALDLAEDIVTGTRLRRSLPLAAGDLLVVDNRVVMHNRTAYEDHADPTRRRRLLRGWVRLPG